MDCSRCFFLSRMVASSLSLSGLRRRIPRRLLFEEVAQVVCTGKFYEIVCNDSQNAGTQNSQSNGQLYVVFQPSRIIAFNKCLHSAVENGMSQIDGETVLCRNGKDRGIQRPGDDSFLSDEEP